MKTAFLYQVEKDKVRCLACHHRCLLGAGKRGLCGVRENRKGELQLLVYGKVAACHLDPIEKKPLYHFLPGKEAFSLGTVGCNFRCGFCQNWQISQEREIIGEELSPEEIKKRASHYPILAYTYNEPTVFFEYAYDIARRLKDKKHVFVSNGYFTDEALAKMDFLDGINIDLKSFREDFYRKNCGAKLPLVLDNIKKCRKKGIWVEVTTLLIPQENDSEEEIRDIAKFIASVDTEMPWHISAFHPDYKMLNKQSTAFQDLLKAYRIAKEAGLNYVYLGNTLSEPHNSTYCPRCEKLLVRRRGYYISVEGLKNSRCRYCGCLVKGVWG